MIKLTERVNSKAEICFITVVVISVKQSIKDIPSIEEKGKSRNEMARKVMSRGGVSFWRDWLNR